MTALQATLLVVVAVAGGIAALIRQPTRQIVALNIFGLTLALLFFAFSAPDVALSELAVGGVVLPAIVLLALARVRSHER
jgi:energy-converting hydrogenase B subunit D